MECEKVCKLGKVEEMRGATGYVATNQVSYITGVCIYLRRNGKKSIGICCRRQCHVCVLLVVQRASHQ